jgi:hypothetical protein
MKFDLLKLLSLGLTVGLALKSKGNSWPVIRDSLEDSLLDQVGLTRSDVDSVIKKDGE